MLFNTRNIAYHWCSTSNDKITMTTIQTVTVYLGSSGYCRQIFKDSTVQLGEMIAERGYSLVYGGMDAGLMGVLAKAVLKNGGDVTGVVPQKLKDSERVLQGLNDLIMVNDLWDRKQRMFDMADAVLALPGGFGTVDESLEILYWAALKLHNKPLVLINIDGYWDELIAYIHTLDDFDDRYLIVVDNVDQVDEALRGWIPVVIPPGVSYHFPHFEDEISRRTFEPVVVDLATVENTYYAICAMGLKQLAKHRRNIGFDNAKGQFDALNKWIKRAHEEKFITDKCLNLYALDSDREALNEKLSTMEFVEIDLHKEKWGDPV
jgi:hypothetical protein